MRLKRVPPTFGRLSPRRRLRQVRLHHPVRQCLDGVRRGPVVQLPRQHEYPVDTQSREFGDQANRSLSSSAGANVVTPIRSGSRPCWTALLAHHVDQLGEFSRGAGGEGRNPSPRRPAGLRADQRPNEPTTIGIDGCAGFGFDDTRLKETNRPSKLAPSPAPRPVARGHISSAGGPPSSQGIPSASNSSFSHPTPIPNSSRPPDSRSRVAQFLRQDERIALRQDHDPGGEAQRRRGRRDIRQPDQRVRDRCGWRHRQPRRSGLPGYGEAYSSG